MTTENITKLVKNGKIYDLGMEYFVGMPHHPNHPPFAFSLTKLHGEVVYEGGVSACNCLFTTGGHTGTHMDALGHIAVHNKVHGVGDIGAWQSYQGLSRGGIDKAAPIVARGVLLDIAGFESVDCLGRDYRIDRRALEGAVRNQGTRIEKGDVVLLRTGWSRFFNEPHKYISHAGCPGLVEEGARWLAERGIVCVGADTVALEKTPTPNLPVHVVLLVENGIHIIEAMNLEDLAREGVFEFCFMASPLKIRGGTASPVRPIAWT